MTDKTDKEEARKELEKKERLLEEMSSIVSHELRNPLNLAKGYLDLAKETGEEEDFDEVKKALDRMEQIIEHIIFLGRKPEKIDKQELNLQEIFEKAWKNVGTDEAEYEVEKKSIYADKSSLQDMLEKMITNSIEHNQKDVTVKAGGLENGFYLEDNGKGIEKGIREKIFDYGFSKKEEGNGFGMPVVKKISDTHGWEYEVKTSESGGARFEFYIEKN